MPGSPKCPELELNGNVQMYAWFRRIQGAHYASWVRLAGFPYRSRRAHCNNGDRTQTTKREEPDGTNT